MYSVTMLPRDRTSRAVVVTSVVAIVAIAYGLALTIYLVWFNEGGEQLPDDLPAAFSVSECGLAIDILAFSSSSELEGGYRYKVARRWQEGQPAVYFDIPEGHTFRLSMEPTAADDPGPGWTLGILSGNSRLILNPADGSEISRRIPHNTHPLNDVFTEIMDSVCVDTPEV